MQEIPVDIIKRRSKINNKYGITSIAIYVNENSCKYSCIYCPQIKGIPKSYIENEDTLRAKKFNYCPTKQIDYWIHIISKQNKTPKSIKLEIIILGGTFSNLSKTYRTNFFKGIYDSLNGFISPNIEFAKINNVTSKYRACVITVETRPELISSDECKFLRKLGVSKVEIGVQTIYNKILEVINRDYTNETIIYSTKLLKQYGFKVGYHMMLRLPYVTPEMDLWMLNEITQNSDYIPDYLKIYPLVYFKEKESQKKLYDLYEKKPWKIANIESIINTLTVFKTNIPEYIRIQRIARQFEFENDFKFLRLKILSNLKRLHKKCKCIRCRELETYESNFVLENNSIYNIKIDYYSENDVFIQALNSTGNLLGYLKLYFSNKIIIREIKVVGESSNISEQSYIQGRGLGKILILEAEKLAIKHKYSKIYVTASPGVYNFYLKLGYMPEATFLLKKL